jgi:DHA1 family bicyclomycin/chloramphenicol resistance-like MFS transporter
LLNFLSTSLDEASEFTNANRRLLLLTLTITCSLGQVASTIYVSSVPAIASALDTSVSRVQLTFVAYLAAFAVSMLVLGPLSDRYGRRRTMILGMSLSALGGIACAASPTIEFLIGARVLQGIGLSAGLVVGRATVRDLYGEDGAAQIIAGLSIVLTLLQALAPIPGGYLQAWIGWRANFVAVTVLTAAALALVLRYVPDSTGGDRTRPQTGAVLALARTMLAGYRGLIHTRRFVAYALTAAGAHAGFHIFAAGAPAVLIIGFAIPPQDYGYYASLPPMGFLVGSFLSNRLTRRLGTDGLIAIGSAVLIPAGFAMVGLAVLHFGSPYAIVGPMVLICCGSGLITPNAVAASLGVKVDIVGAASGLASFLQMAGAACATAALSVGPSGNPLVLAVVVASAGLFAVAAFGSLVQFARFPANAEARVGPARFTKRRVNGRVIRDPPSGRSGPASPPATGLLRPRQRILRAPAGS